MTVKRRTEADFLLSLLLSGGVIFALARVRPIADAVAEGLRLCASSLIPSLFPFMILTDVLARTRAGRRMTRMFARPFARLFRVSDAGAAAWLCGTLFGFPFGARAVADGVKRGVIGKAEARRLLLFCHNAGAAFVIGGVGGMLADPRRGILLWGIEVALSVAAGILSRPRGGWLVSTDEQENDPPDFSLSDALRRAISSMLFVCGCVLLFSAVGALVLPWLPGDWRAFGAAVFEIGSACGRIAAETPEPLTLPLCGWAICFSGISVHLQAAESLEGCDIALFPMIFSKILQGCAAFFLLLFFARIG